MQQLCTKNFGNLSMEVYEKKNSDNFYMSRKQLNEALEYKDSKTLHRIISRHKEEIGEGYELTVPQLEGNILKTRTLELFSFDQIFQILRFSSSPRATDFMRFAATTLKQLLLGKAELVFKKSEDKKAYANEIKEIMSKCSAFGIPKTKSAIMIQQAEIENKDIELSILCELQHKQESEIERKKAMIYNRVKYLATEFYPGKDWGFREIWSKLDKEMKYCEGVDMAAIIDKAKKKSDDEKIRLGSAVTVVPTRTTLIAEYDLFDEAYNAIRRIERELLKESK